MIKARTAELPLKTAEQLIRLPDGITHRELAEVRLRAGRPAVAVTIAGRSIVCSPPLSRCDIEQCFLELCRHSVHSYAREIAEGYITLGGGHRVGFCGTAVMQDGKLSTLRDISSIDLRLAHEVKGCGEELYAAVFAERPQSLLLGGRPMSGKTTVLRDLSRLLGAHYRIALIDSRSELAAVHNGTPSLDVGLNTDVLDGYPRYEGMMTALRTLNPEIIICDEIGGDFAAVERCISCGVKLIATVHAGSLEELIRRPETARLLPLFDSVAVLSDRGRLAQLKSSTKTKETR